MSIVKNKNNITKAFYGRTPIYTFGNIDSKQTDSKQTIIRNGMKLGYSNFSIPDYIVFADDVTDFSFMFYASSNLRELPDINTSNATNMNSMFYNCNNLVTVSQLDTSKVTNMSYMFYNCTNLKTIPELDCSSLERLPSDMFYGCLYLTNVGGFTNLRYSIDLGRCIVLSQQSIYNIVSKLIPVEETKTIRFAKALEMYFSEEWIASATEKNWIISFV